MAASSFSSFLLLFFFSQLISTTFSSMHEFYGDPLVQQVVSSDGRHDLLTSAEHHFLAFKRKYGKTYPTQEEEDYRFGVFMSSLRQAKRIQIEDPTAVHGVTKFSDLTVSEFRQIYSSPLIKLPNDIQPNGVNSMAPHLPSEPPASVNWIENGTVTRVKNQGKCNSCWAFATIAVIEGAYARVNHKLVNLSEQQLIDCSKNYGVNGTCNHGCCGGHRLMAFRYVKNCGGVMAEEDYHYTSKDTVCKEEKNNCSSNTQNDQCPVCKVNKITASIDKYHYIHGQDNFARHLSEDGPIAVSVELDLLKTYQSGVLCRNKITSPPGADIIAHAVALVGYENRATPGKIFYWIAKNSYGEDYGENGYFRICNDTLLNDWALIAFAKKDETASTPPSPVYELN